MLLKDHLLSGENVRNEATPNQGAPLVPQYLIVHYTAGRSAESSVRHFQDPAARASAHLVIGRDARIWQLVPFNRVAWHAGVSAWGGLQGMNHYSIGIELDNAGRLTKVGDRYQAWFGGSYPADQVVQARHQNEDRDAFWHAYTDQQLEATLEVSRMIVREYGLKDVLGHEDIAPGRKSDPGPAFRMASFRASLLGRGDDSRERVQVDVPLLNIRSGPGIEYPTVAKPLKLRTLLQLIQMGGLWAHVATIDGSGIEGWVRSSFISPSA
jgi:N-acetylmuramoyl-L-alanine amidase